MDAIHKGRCRSGSSTSTASASSGRGCDADERSGRHVYLSRGTGGRWDEGTSLYLGALKATNGFFSYEVPAAADVASYQSVVVSCRAFRVLITWADLPAA